MNRNHKSKITSIILIIVLFIFLMICGHKSSGQTVEEYYPAKVYLIYANGDTVEDNWKVRYEFDNINSLVYFNMQPNETEEFTVIHKIYNIRDIFDNRHRLIDSEYYLDDMAVLYIKALYDNLDNIMDQTGCRIKLVETIPYSIRRMDIRAVEIIFFTYF